MNRSRFSAGALVTAVFATVLIAAATLGGIASAGGNPGGQLIWLECIGAGGCAQAPTSPLDQPTGLQISSDESRVYVTAYADNTLTMLRRNRKSGTLSQTGLDGAKGCVSEGGTGGCGTARAMVGPTGIANVGSTIYVASPTSSAVALFRQDQFSKLWKQADDLTGCYSENGTGGTCTDGYGLTGAQSVALFPDSYGSTYVGGTNTIAWFKRNKTTGALEERGCINDDGSDGCTNGIVPGNVTDINITGDHKFLYATASGTPGALLAFSIFRGDLTEMYCVNDDGSGGCFDSAAPLLDPQGVQGDEQLRSLYVAANGSDTLTAFQRDRKLGSITPNGCYNPTSTGGCALGLGLTDLQRVRVCGNGDCVEVSAGDGVASFFRNHKTGILSQPTSDPLFHPCFNTTGSGGCLFAAGLGGAMGIDSIGGGIKHLYVAGSTDDAVSEFHLR